MLLGMIMPTAGSTNVVGERVRADAPGLWRRVGHLVESATAYPELSDGSSTEASLAHRAYASQDAISVARPRRYRSASVSMLF